jgi:hypothetical protein
VTRGSDSGSMSYFSVGDITGSSDVVIGNNSAIVKGGFLPQVRHDLLGKLDEILSLLDDHAGSVADAAGVREAIEEAESEVRKPSPRWSIVRTLLRGVAVPVAGVAALTEVVNNVLEIVSHLVN